MSAKKPDPEATRPEYRRGMEVRVEEQGITPWRGVAEALKWSSVSGWWFDVRRDEDGMTLIMHASRVRRQTESKPPIGRRNFSNDNSCNCKLMKNACTRRKKSWPNAMQS